MLGLDVVAVGALVNPIYGAGLFLTTGLRERRTQQRNADQDR
jgi:hypothetical protein